MVKGTRATIAVTIRIAEFVSKLQLPLRSAYKDIWHSVETLGISLHSRGPAEFQPLPFLKAVNAVIMPRFFGIALHPRSPSCSPEETARPQKPY